MNTYGGTTRLHRLQSGDALDRRRIEELYLQAGRRANEIFDRNIGNKQFGRTFFQEHSIQEFWYNSDSSINYFVPQCLGNLPGTIIPVRNDDSFVFGEIVWSIRVLTFDGSVMLVVWPVFNSQALWSGEDVSLRLTECSYPPGVGFTDPIKGRISGSAYSGTDMLSMGGTTNFVGMNGRMISGLLVHSIGNFRIVATQFAIRMRNR